MKAKKKSKIIFIFPRGSNGLNYIFKKGAKDIGRELKSDEETGGKQDSYTRGPDQTGQKEGEKQPDGEGS